jgi:hypothetical protein
VDPCYDTGSNADNNYRVFPIIKMDGGFYGYLCYWANHSLPSCTEVKNEYIYTLIPPCAFMVFAEQFEICLSENC